MDVAVSKIFGFLDDVKARGISESLSCGSVRTYELDKALTLVASNGCLAKTVATVVLETIGDVFVDTVLHRFDSNARNCSSAAPLVSLAQSFTEAESLLARVGEFLGETLWSRFSVFCRCLLLKDDFIAARSPQSKLNLLAHVEAHASSILRLLESGSDALLVQQDPTFRALSTLKLSTTPEVQIVWRAVLRSAIDARVEHLGVGIDFGPEGRVERQISWKQEVVDTFVHIAFGLTDATVGLSGKSEIRVEVDKWCDELDQYLLCAVGRKLVQNFWSLVIDYPTSIPALRDLRICLSRVSGRGLLNELIAHVKSVLALRLHRAGTSTDDILTALVSTIRSVSVLINKHDQSTVVFAICGDTLKHLRDRRDSIAAVVADITQASCDSILFSDSRPAAASPSKRALEEDSDQEAEEEESLWGVNRSPDVLRVLLSTMSVQAILDEFRMVLAARLLRKPQHDYDTGAEEEIMERMKCVFGEDLLNNCTVMVRDISASRRMNHRIAQARPPSTLSGNAPRLSATILSSTCWPKVASLFVVPSEVPQVSFQPHPALEELMAGYANAFRQQKPNQQLLWIPTLGRVTLRIKQKDGVTGDCVSVLHELSVFCASMVLHLRDGPLSLDALAEKMGCSAAVVHSRATHHVPVVFVLNLDKRTVGVQPAIIASSSLAFDDKAAQQPEEAPSQANEDLSVITNAVLAMLKARGASKTVAEIHNSLKIFIRFSGTAADLKRALQTLVADGKLSTPDGNTFSLSKS